MVFHNGGFGYQNKKIIFPKKEYSKCSSLIPNVSFSCNGRRVITVTEINDDSFDVSTTLEEKQKNYFTIVKNGFVKAKNVCTYSSNFMPLRNYQYHEVSKLNCNALTKNVCQIINEVYWNPTREKDDTILDEALYKRFYDIISSVDYQSKQYEYSSGSYNSIFNLLNNRNGKNKSSVSLYPKNYDDYNIAKKSKRISYGSLLTLIEGEDIKNFTELHRVVDKKMSKSGYFQSVCAPCRGLIGLEMFQD